MACIIYQFFSWEDTLFHLGGYIFHFGEVIEMEAKTDYKCYNCGYAAVDEAHLRRHKNRKTPCLIREVKPEDVKNPNRCIYCNKVMSTIGNLTKHLKTCKVKNGGLQMLHDKVKHEEQMRILQEETLQNNKELTIMVSEMHLLKEEIRELRAAGPMIASPLGGATATVGANGIAAAGDITINANNTNNTNNTFNIIVNNYNNPNVEHLKDVNTFAKLLNRELSATPIALVEQFWFDPEYPENISVHLVNKKTGEVLVSVEGKWVTDSAQNVIPTMRQIVYEFTQKMMVAHPDRLITLATDMVPGFLARNRNNDKVIKMDFEEIFQKLIDGRQVSQQQLDKFKQMQILCK